MRTPDEIVARMKALEAGTADWMGTIRSDLLHALPFNLAQPYLKDGVTADQWDANEGLTPDETTVIAAATEYLAFAVGKAIGHRGLSAGRSVDHYSAWLWLLLDDQEFADWEDVEFPRYGAPMIAAAAGLLGVVDVAAHCQLDADDKATWQLMSHGHPCDDCATGYDSGCLS